MATLRRTSQPKTAKVTRRYNQVALYGLQAQNKSALDILNEYQKRIQNNEWLSSEDRAKYKAAIDKYTSSGNALRKASEFYGTKYTPEEEKSWNDALSSLSGGYTSINDFYNQFADENVYSDWRKYYAPIDDVDYDKYVEAGKNASNPTWNQAHAPVDILGWQPFGSGQSINNMVTFAEANKTQAEIASAQAIRGGGTSTYGEIVGLINSYMTDEEKARYNYYVGKGDTAAAEDYLNYMIDELRRRQGGQIAAQVDNSGLELLTSGLAGLQTSVSGYQNFVKGFIGGQDPVHTTALQYAHQQTAENNKGAWKVMNDLSYTTGNMAPSIAVGALTGGVGGAITMGGSSAGNAYAEMIQQGYTKNQARAYGLLTGASEAALSYALGGISKLGGGKGGIFQSISNKVLPSVNNGLARFAIEIGGNMADEALEEAAQTVLESVFKHAVTLGEEKIDIDWGEVAYSGLLGALSAGTLEGIPSAIGTGLANYKANIVNGNLTVGEAIQAAISKETKLAEAFKQGQARVTKAAGEYANYLTQLDADNKAAQYVQGRIEKGKNVSGYQINRLATEIDTALTNNDTAAIKTAVEARLTELGETGDVSAIADVIARQTAGEDISFKDKNIVKGSKFAERVANELNRDNIQSGQYSSAWAEGIGTKRVNADVYNRQTKAETANPTPENARATEAKISAPSERVSPTIVTKNAEGKTVKSEISGIEVDGGKATFILANNEKVSADKATFQTETQKLVADMAIEKVSRVEGFSTEAATVMVKGYTDNLTPGEYNKVFTEAFNAGKEGLNTAVLRKMAANNNVSEATLFAAYDIGREFTKNSTSVLKTGAESGIINTVNAEATNEGRQGLSLRGSVQRSNSQNTQGQLSQLESGAGQAEGRRETSRSPADEEATRLVDKGRRVSVADLGIPGGSKYQTVYRLEGVEETASMKKAREKAEARGLTVRFFAGDNLHIEDGRGGIDKDAAYIQGKYVYIRADHPDFTAEQLMEHELGHDKVAKGEINVKKVINRLKEILGEDYAEVAADFYAEIYAGTGLKPQEVLEELVCDSLGDMNVFSKSKKYVEAAEVMKHAIPAIQQAVAETKTEATNPDAKTEGKASRDMSDEDYKNFGWVRDKNVISAGHWKSFTTNFADAIERNYFFNKTPNSEFMIEAYNYYDIESVADVIVFAKGTIESPIITQIIRINSNNNQVIEDARLEIYALERRGVHSKAGGLLNIYTRANTRWISNVGGSSYQNASNNNQLGAKRSRSEIAANPVVKSEVNEDAGTVTVTYKNGDVVTEPWGKGKASRELDLDYIDAVNRGDMETAQKMVDEAAKEAGYKDTLYHGTKSFGFTEFDASRSDDKISFFVTSSEDIAQSYSGKYGSMKISDLESYDNKPLHEVVKKLREVSQESYEGKQLNSQYKIMSMTDVNSLIMEVNDGIEKLKNTVNEKIKDYAEILATDFNDSDYKTHEYLVKLKGLIDNYSYSEMSTPIYILLHRTEAFDRSSEIAELEYKIRLMNRLANKDTSNGVVVEKQLDGYGIALYTPEEARETLKEQLSSGNYKLYGNPGNQLVIKGEGQNWNKLKNWQKSVKKTTENTYAKKENGNYVLYDKATDKVIEGSEVPLNQYNENLPLETMHGILVSKENNRLAILTEGKTTTRDIAKFAKDNGYDSVKFEDIEDSGGRGDEAMSGDVYAYFRSSSLKSADPVTYDDDGNVIPLSERFNPENKDIRFSRELDLDYDESIEATKTVTNRELLANALESAAQSDDEYSALQKYKKNIKELNKKTYHLSKLKEEIKKLSFGKGQKDAKRLAELKEKAAKLEKSINYYDRQLVRLEAMKPIKDLVQRERSKAYKAAAEKGREALHRNVEGRHKSEARAKIKKLKQKFQSIIEHPTDRQYIPVDLMSAMIDVCDLIDTSTPLYKADGSINKAQQARNEQTQRLLKLKAEYDALAKSADYALAYEYEQEVADYIQTITLDYANRNISEMTLAELTVLYQMMRSIEETLRDARRLIGWSDAMTVYEAGDSIIEEQTKIGENRKQNGITKADDAIVNLSLSPVRAVLRMAGYNEDSALYHSIREIENGTREQKKFVMDAVKKFESLTTGKNVSTYEKAIYDPYGKELIDKNGQKFHVTKMQMMQAIMSYEREMANDKLHHVSNGGFTFADIKLLGKGEVREAVSAKYAHTITLGSDVAVKFMSELANDKWAQEYMAEARNFFDVTAKEAINEANMKLKHRIVATGKNYIPYEVNSDFIVREINSENDIQQVISGYGMLKDLKEGASQPLIITGLNNVLDRHIEQVGNVAALAVPIRNFNKIWNVKSTDGSTTVREKIKANWGTGGEDLITQAIKDVQGSRRQDNNWIYKLYKKAKGNIIQGTFLGNVSVVFKQIGSMYTATSMLNYRDPASMMANLIATKANRDAIAAEVNKYTAVAWVRGQGLSDAELYELKTTAKRSKLGRAVDKLPPALNAAKWITQMDYDVALSLWKYAKEDTAKRTGLKGEELLKATADYYNDVIENTQSMSDALHRPEVQKSDNIVSETLGIFKTDLYQNAGLLRVALESRVAKPSKENSRALVKAVCGTLSSMCWGALINSVMAALRYKPDRYRDEEDDEITLESWLKVAGGDMLEEMFGYMLPLFGSEAAGLLKAWITGETYEFDNLTLEAINGLSKAMTSAGKIISEGENDPEKILRVIKNALVKGTSVFGVPANNVTRFLDAVRLHAKDIANGEFLSFEAGLTSPNAQRLYNAYIEGDADKIKKASRLYEDQKAIDSALRKQLRENDPRMKEAANAYIAGDYAKYNALRAEIVAEGIFDNTLVTDALKAEINYIKNKDKESE